MITRQSSVVSALSPGRDANWRDRSACADDWAPFHAGVDSPPSEPPQPWEQDAIRICNRCPVKTAAEPRN